MNIQLHLKSPLEVSAGLAGRQAEGLYRQPCGLLSEREATPHFIPRKWASSIAEGRRRRNHSIGRLFLPRGYQFLHCKQLLCEPALCGWPEVSWKMLDSLQLMVFLPMLQIAFPANSKFFFEHDPRLAKL